MAVLLLGATGCVGSAIYEYLNGENILTPSSSELDITDAVQVARYFTDNNIDIIINASASSLMGNDFSIFHINSLGSINLANFANQCGVAKFIQVSSISSISDNDNKYFSSYGLSKLIADEYIDMINRSSSCQYYILRCSQIISSKNLERQGFIKHVLNKIMNNEDVVLYGKNDPKRNLITTETVCKTIEYLLNQEKGKESSCMYNVINPKTRTLTETIQWISDLYDRNTNIFFDDDKEDILDYVIPVPDPRIMRVLENSNAQLAQEILKYNEIYNEKN